MTLVYLVRHARAGERERWRGDDRLRPLDARGWRQAEGLADLLAPRGVVRLLTSPYERCLQTLEPLAAILALPLERSEELSEGAERALTLGLVTGLAAPAAACTHGDVVEALLGPQTRCEKGATWVLEAASGDVTVLEYLPPVEAVGDAPR